MLLDLLNEEHLSNPYLFHLTKPRNIRDDTKKVRGLLSRLRKRRNKTFFQTPVACVASCLIIRDPFERQQKSSQHYVEVERNNIHECTNSALDVNS